MNYQPFYDLSKQTLRYMNPEYDWRFIHADCFAFYNLLPQYVYNSSFPLWEQNKEILFTEIRNHIGLPKAVISNLTLVRATEHTICHEMKRHCGIIMVSGEAYAAVYGGEYESSFKLAKRAIGMVAPHLNHWHNYDAFGFNVAPDKVLFPGARPLNFYPKPGAVFYYFKVDDKWLQKQGISL